MKWMKNIVLITKRLLENVLPNNYSYIIPIYGKLDTSGKNYTIKTIKCCEIYVAYMKRCHVT